MAERIFSRLQAFAAAAAIALCLVVAPVRAQPGQLEVDPCKVAGFTEAEQQQIAEFAERQLSQLDQAPDKREPARKAILGPLTQSCVSVAFRQLYRAAMIEDLTRLAASDNEEVAINAMVILGELADDQARQVLQTYTADKRLAVRFAAIAGLKRMFLAIESSAPALDAQRASEVVEHLAARLAEEQDPDVVDLIVRTLVAAGAISRDGYSVPAAQATAALANGMGARLRAADEGARPKLLLSTLRVAQSLSDKLASAASTSAETARAGGAFAGEVLAHLAVKARSGDIPPGNQLAKDLVNLCERVIVFAHQRMGETLSPPPALKATYESGDVNRFYNDVRQLVLSLNGDKSLGLSEEAMKRISDALSG